MTQIHVVRQLPPPDDPHQVRALVSGKRPKRKKRKRGKERHWAYWWK